MIWSGAELKVLKELYADYGANAVAAATGRSKGSVWGMAKALNIKCKVRPGSGNKFAYRNVYWKKKP